MHICKISNDVSNGLNGSVSTFIVSCWFAELCVTVGSNHMCALLSKCKERKVGGGAGVVHIGQSWSWKMEEEEFPTIGHRWGWKCYSEKLLSTFPNRETEKKFLVVHGNIENVLCFNYPDYVLFFPTLLSPLLLSQERKLCSSCYGNWVVAPAEGLRKGSRWNRDRQKCTMLAYRIENNEWLMNTQKLLQNKFTKGMIVNHHYLITGCSIIWKCYYDHSFHYLIICKNWIFELLRSLITKKRHFFLFLYFFSPPNSWLLVWVCLDYVWISVITWLGHNFFSGIKCDLVGKSPCITNHNHVSFWVNILVVVSLRQNQNHKILTVIWISINNSVPIMLGGGRKDFIFHFSHFQSFR